MDAGLHPAHPVIGKAHTRPNAVARGDGCREKGGKALEVALGGNDLAVCRPDIERMETSLPGCKFGPWRQGLRSTHPEARAALAKHGCRVSHPARGSTR